MLKEQMEALIQENTILKRAVSTQHERQKECEDRGQELQHLKQLVAQYQEQLRTLEVELYTMLHFGRSLGFLSVSITRMLLSHFSSPGGKEHVLCFVKAGIYMIPLLLVHLDLFPVFHSHCLLKLYCCFMSSMYSDYYCFFYTSTGEQLCTYDAPEASSAKQLHSRAVSP